MLILPTKRCGIKENIKTWFIFARKRKHQNIMKITNQIVRYLVGGLFIFSGLIKLNDPRGLQIKLEEYFEVFASDKTEWGLASLSGLWHFLLPYSLWLGTTLSVLEVVLGVHLLVKYRYRFSLWALLGMIIFFTFLTFYSALFNKVTDCGCFGDAIKLTPWQSFSKDLLLWALLSFLLFQKETDTEKTVWKIATSITSTVLAIVLAIWAIEHLPPLDFRAYRIGSDIKKNMTYSGTPKYGAEVYTFTNKKTKGTESTPKYAGKFLDTNTYKYKSYEKPLLNPEVNPKITDYRVSSPEGADVTQKTFEGKKLLIVIADFKNVDVKAMKKINDLARLLEAKKIETMILTNAGSEEFDKFRHEHQISIPYYSADKVVLKTMIRSNPGIMYWENAVVKNMWHYNDIPTDKAF